MKNLIAQMCAVVLVQLLDVLEIARGLGSESTFAKERFNLLEVVLHGVCRDIVKQLLLRNANDWTKVRRYP